MLDEVLDRDADPCKTAPDDRTQADPSAPTAREILAGWVVTISLPSFAHNNPSEFGALIATAVVTAWADRRIPGRPPGGGFPALSGTTARNWRRWRDLAIELGLIKTMRGGAGLAPVAQREAGGQFARVPLARLIDRELPRTAKRVYCALALYGSDHGLSRAGVRTLTTASGLNRGNVPERVARTRTPLPHRAPGRDR